MTSRRARHRPGTAPTALLVLAVLVTPLAACGGDEPAAPGTVTVTSTVSASQPGSGTTGDGTGGTATTTATSTATATATATGSSTPATDGPTAGVPTSTADVQAEASGSQVFLVDARVAGQQGFDRVVWELAGDGTPGYRVGWTDDPRRDGSGEEVDLDGDATLQVVLVGVGIPPDAPAGTDVYSGPATVSAGDTETVTEVEVGTVFEGYLTGFVGAEDERPFSVTLLRDPTRVVVDIAH